MSASLSAVQQAKAAAAAAFHSARMRADGPREFIGQCWQTLIERNHHALASGTLDDQFNAANEARIIMEAIANLPADRYRALAAPEHRRAGNGGYYPEETEAAAAAIASSPVLAKFQAECDQAAQERAAEAEAKRQAAEAARLRNLPSDLLASLRSRGVELRLTGNGNHIGAIPVHLALMQQPEIDTIIERRADFLALLRSEALALVPVVIV